jgi:iron complex transport system ATP-binding protein
MTLQAESIHFSYGKHQVLAGVSLETRPGEVTFLIGQNGSGKSTLIRCLLGQLRPQQGRILLDGRPISTFQPEHIAIRISYIPQVSLPTFNYSVLQMVLMGRTSHLGLLASPQARDYSLAREALDRLGIGNLSDKGYAEISGGEQQLVLIARALAQQSEIMLMDEPTSSLDYGNQLRILQRIRELAEHGRSVLISSHSPQHALLFADRILALADGSIVSGGVPREVLTTALLRRRNENHRG